MPQPNYEALVKTVYPDAYNVRDCGGFVTYEIRVPETRVSGLEHNAEDAWKSAYDKLIKQNKIKPQ